MTLFWHFLPHVFFVGLTGLVAASPRAERLTPATRIELKSDAVVSGRQVTLADIAAIGVADVNVKRSLEELRIGNVPLIGYVARLSRTDLEQLVRKRLPELDRVVEWGGAGVVNVRSASRLIDADVVVDVAKNHLRTELGSRFESVDAELASPVADVELPLGDVTFKPRAVDVKRVHARMPVWIDMYLAGALYRSVVVPFTVTVSRAVYAARRDLAEGSFVSADDFVVRTEEALPGSDERIRPSELQAGLRIKKALIAGQVVTRKDLSTKDTVFQGEQVKLVVAEGAVMVETPALVQQEAQVGQLVKVRIGKDTETVMGRIVSAGVIQAIGR